MKVVMKEENKRKPKRRGSTESQELERRKEHLVL